MQNRISNGSFPQPAHEDPQCKEKPETKVSEGHECLRDAGFASAVTFCEAGFLRVVRQIDHEGLFEILSKELGWYIAEH